MVLVVNLVIRLCNARWLENATLPIEAMYYEAKRLDWRLNNHLLTSNTLVSDVL